MILGVEAVLDAPGSIPGEEGRKSIIILVPRIGTVNANESRHRTRLPQGPRAPTPPARGAGRPSVATSRPRAGLRRPTAA